jgi:hypothetical protein
MLQFLAEYPLLDVLRVGLDTFQKPYFGTPIWVLIVYHHVNAKVMMDNDTNPLQIGKLDEQLQRTRGLWRWTLASAAGFTR